MENMIKETIEIGITEKSVNIPLIVTMVSENAEEKFEYDLSIDELGQIIVTPSNTTCEFTNVVIDEEADERDTPLSNITCTEDNICSKEFTLNLDATMLCESEECLYNMQIDEIGQIVIQPNKKEDSFLTVTEKDSLELVTEDFQLTEYLGYTLRNSGDGWDIIDSDGNVIDTGVATLPKAKLSICKMEMDKLTEEIETEDPVDIDTAVEEVQAEVIVESTIPEWVEYAELCELTNNFESKQGAIECDTEEEMILCAEHLKEHYPSVETRCINDKFVVCYHSTLDENFSELDIVDKVMKGDITIFEGEGKPEESYILLTSLTSDNLEYYFDPESGSVVTFIKE